MTKGKAMSGVEKEVMEETRKRIDRYRSQKQNNIFDIFYHSHLNFIKKCIKFYEDSFIPDKKRIRNSGLVLVGSWECPGTAGTSSQLYINDDGTGELIDIGEINNIVRFTWVLEGDGIVANNDSVNALLSSDSFCEVEEGVPQMTNLFYRM